MPWAPGYASKDGPGLVGAAEGSPGKITGPLEPRAPASFPSAESLPLPNLTSKAPHISAYLLQA